MSRRPWRHASCWPAIAAACLMAACATPYVMTRHVDARYDLSVGDGVRLAARAMQAAGYFPTQQNDAAGHIVGERNDKDSLGLDVLTLYIEVKVTRGTKGGLTVNTTCSVSKNIVYTDQLDDECEKFRASLDKLLAERDAAPSRVRSQTVVPQPAVAPPAARPPATPAPTIPAPEAPSKPASQGRGYSL